VLTSGEELRDAINDLGTGGTPISEVQLNSAEIYQDNQRAALLLVAPEGVTGETTLTVTAMDAAGNESSQTITVNIVAPSGANVESNPFLNDIPDLNATIGVEQTFQLTAQDVEDDDVRFLDFDQIEVINNGIPLSSEIQIPSFAGSDTFNYDVDIDTGLVTFTAGAGSPDTVEFVVGVAQAPRLGEGISNSNVDIQVVRVNVSS